MLSVTRIHHLFEVFFCYFLGGVDANTSVMSKKQRIEGEEMGQSSSGSGKRIITKLIYLGKNNCIVSYHGIQNCLSGFKVVIISYHGI